MLVLSRGNGQQIKIGEEVTIHINKIRGGKVSIGIEAPETVIIRRGEITKRPVIVDQVIDPQQPTTTAPTLEANHQ